MDKIEYYANELEKVRLHNNGILNPRVIVKIAANDKSPLHDYFEWDDTKASHEYRLWQARQLISVIVTVLPNDNEPIRMYVSLKDDRKRGAKGYRQIVDVLNDGELRKRLLIEAFAEFKYFKQKYQQLKEFIPVFEAMEKVEKVNEVEVELQEV